MKGGKRESPNSCFVKKIIKIENFFSYTNQEKEKKYYHIRNERRNSTIKFQYRSIIKEYYKQSYSSKFYSLSDVG